MVIISTRRSLGRLLQYLSVLWRETRMATGLGMSHLSEIDWSGSFCSGKDGPGRMGGEELLRLACVDRDRGFTT